MLFAKARAAGTLIKILIILFAALALVVFVVLLSVFLRIEYLELDLINEARSGLVKPPKQTFFVFAFVINYLLLAQGHFLFVVDHARLGLSLVHPGFASGHQILVLL